MKVETSKTLQFKFANQFNSQCESCSSASGSFAHTERFAAFRVDSQVIHFGNASFRLFISLWNDRESRWWSHILSGKAIKCADRLLISPPSRRATEPGDPVGWMWISNFNSPIRMLIHRFKQQSKHRMAIAQERVALFAHSLANSLH